MKIKVKQCKFNFFFSITLHKKHFKKSGSTPFYSGPSVGHFFKNFQRKKDGVDPFIIKN